MTTTPPDAAQWDVPPDTEVTVHGEHTITVIGPRTLKARPAELPAHDPAAAREFAESFGTVEAVLGTLPDMSFVPRETRDDLDVIEVGHWGDVLSISDPALADTWSSQPLWRHAAELRERFPDSLIVGAASVDCGMDYMEYAIHVPGGPSLEAEGWHGEEPWTVEGDPREIARALGITAEALEEMDLDLDEEHCDFDWDGLCDLALTQTLPASDTVLEMSLFRVRHTESAMFDLTETWLTER